MGIRLKDLSKLGYRDNVACSLIVDIVGKHCKHNTSKEILETLAGILVDPDAYKSNEVWGKLAEHLSLSVLSRKDQ